MNLKLFSVSTFYLRTDGPFSFRDNFVT